MLLSGIGDPAHLEQHGIEPRVDAPGVGRNLQDHLNVKINYACEKPITLDDADSLWNLLKYLVLNRGPLT